MGGVYVYTCVASAGVSAANGTVLMGIVVDGGRQIDYRQQRRPINTGKGALAKQR